MTPPYAVPAPSRFSGCLLGGALGDALGGPVEFMNAIQIRSGYGEGGVRELAQHAEIGNTPYGHAGAITDDTQMTLFTAEGLLRAAAAGRAGGTETDSAAAVYGAYLRWLLTQGGEPEASAPPFSRDGWLLGVDALHARRAPGNTCVSALVSGTPGTAAEPLNDSKGCGGVMRVAPVGLLVGRGDAFVLGRDTAALTHGHPSGYLASGVMAALIAGLRDGLSLWRAYDAAYDDLRRHAEEAERREVEGYLDEAWYYVGEGFDYTDEAAVEGLGQGWVAEEALAIGLMAAGRALRDDELKGDEERFVTGVAMAVNHRGDSDSTGSIAGQILGAALGVEALPEPDLERLELRGVVEQVADDLHDCWAGVSGWEERYPAS